VRIVRLLISLFIALVLSAVQLVPLDGDEYSRMLKAHRGKVVLVDFWATWCEPCREELPRLVSLSKKLDSSKFQLITISADEPEQEAGAAAILDKEGVAMPRYVKHVEDDQVFIDAIDKQWSGALPALFLYDASGKLAARFIGDSDPGEVEAAVRRALR
jgi:thiol-disulfide isomerase/thioredoxin